MTEREVAQKILDGFSKLSPEEEEAWKGYRAVIDLARAEREADQIQFCNYLVREKWRLMGWPMATYPRVATNDPEVSRLMQERRLRRRLAEATARKAR